MQGQPLKAVRELLEHATIEMTMRYAHLSSDVRPAVDVLDIDNKSLANGLAQEEVG